MDRHQRTRARGVDGDRRPAEVEEVGHPVGDDRRTGARDRVGVCDRRVGDSQELVVVGGAADEYADGAAAQAGRRDPGVLECLPGQFQRHPLLRVDVVGFGLGHREELGVEALDVLEVTAAGARVGDPLGDPRLFQEFRPAALGQIGDRVAALEQRLPGFFRGCSCRRGSGWTGPRSRCRRARPGRCASSRRRRVPSSGRSGSPSTIRVASDSMVGCWNATATDSVTPVMSSMSAAIATASRDAKPSSTIGTDSSIASGDFPTALPTHSRSHWRISGTVMSAFVGGRVSE